LFGIKTISTGRINTKQIESMTRFISKKIKKQTGYTVKNITLNKTLTKKPTGIRMGKGKGDIKDIISYVSKGSNLFEINRYKKLTYNISFLQKACKRSPIDSKIIFNYKTQANIFNPSIQYCN
jgi:large subunit ribosomal protein L16